ncbi:MAG: carboxymuconolactone decarboxylase family protein [Rhodospirillales bacterium]|nr:MAG: carboxymuconolactone decarboxylase family protein [Rhodospirillales bacterium]
MSGFILHTVNTAPEGARERLAKAQEKMGFVPNLWAIQAESPEMLEAYQTLAGIFDRTGFSIAERQVVMMTVNAENGCTFCVAAHSAIAKMQGIAPEIVLALRDGTPIQDAKLEALRVFTRLMVQRRGWLEGAEVEAFKSAGYTNRDVLNVVLGVGYKILSNYTNHLADTPLNDAFKPFAWKNPADAPA